MRIFISTFIDAADDANPDDVLSDAISEIIHDDTDASALSEEAYSVLNQAQVLFTDSSDKDA